MMVGGLAVRAGLGYNCGQSRTHSGAGFDSPTHRRNETAPSKYAVFLWPQHGRSNGVAVWEGATPAGPMPGLSTRTVPPPCLTAGDAGDTTRKHRSPIMAKQPTPGTNPSQITHVSISTVEKRVRRALAKQGLSLFKPRPSLAIPAGECAITDGPYRIIRSGLTLEDLARELGVLAEHETLVKPGQAAAIEGGAA